MAPDLYLLNLQEGQSNMKYNWDELWNGQIHWKYTMAAKVFINVLIMIIYSILFYPK